MNPINIERSGDGTPIRLDMGYGYTITKHNSRKWAINKDGQKVASAVDMGRAIHKVSLLLDAQGIMPYKEFPKQYEHITADCKEYLSIDEDGSVWRWSESQQYIFRRTDNELLGQKDKLNWEFIASQGYKKLVK